MRKKIRQYTQEFKLEAIQLAATSDKTLTELEQELGITPGLLSKWTSLPNSPDPTNVNKRQVGVASKVAISVSSVFLPTKVVDCVGR